MIRFEKVSKSFGTNNVLDSLSGEILDGQFISIVGQTGCGKTTFLNILSKNESPTSGVVIYEGYETISYVLQDSIMLPWRTLAENIKLPLEIKKLLSVDKQKVVSDYIHRFGLEGYENVYPQVASGGMKQRAALIRALITEPDVLFLDEPFSSLDFETKLTIQKELNSYKERRNAKMIMVTHDIEDAIAMSDRIIALSGKPAKSKFIDIDLSLAQKDPISARKAKGFSAYFSRVWDGLKN